MILELVGVSPALSKVVVPPWKRPRDPEPLVVFVQTSTCRLKIPFKEEETADGLKAKIRAILGTSLRANDMFLVCNGIVISGCASLLSQGVGHNSVVQLSLWLR